MLASGQNKVSVAAALGVHRDTVGRVAARASFPRKHPEQQVSDERVEVSGNACTVSLPKTRICTLEQLVEHCKIDLKVWEVERFVANKWEVGAKDADSNLVVEPLFQVKAFLRRRVEMESAALEIEELKTLACQSARNPAKLKRPKKLTGNMLEINMPDLHFGKLAWGVETGGPNYDTKIAEATFRKALGVLLERVSGYSFDQIVFVVGNDLLQSDNPEGQTTKGTQVSCDGRYHKTFRLVRTLMIEAVERMREIAPLVKVVMVRGNHDSLSVWHLGDSLECYFHKYKDVEIDNQPRSRKYHRFGAVLLMFTHGHEGKLAEYPMLMAVEQPEMFGATKYRECHTGHKHKKMDSRIPQVDEKLGVRVRILSALCPADDWHADNGFIGNLQSAEAFVWNRDEGMIATAVYNG